MVYQHFTREEIQKLVHKGKLQYDFSKTTVQGDFDCSYMGLTTLEGSPKSVFGNFNCSNNQLHNLKYSPISVYKSFNCSGNQIYNFQDLLDQQRTYYEDFICINTKISNLKGLENLSLETINISNNKFLTSFDGIPTDSDIGVSIIFNTDDANLRAQVDWYREVGRKGYINFWNSLLKYSVENKLEYIDIVKWPTGYINDNLKSSAKGIGKFSL